MHLVKTMSDNIAIFYVINMKTAKPMFIGIFVISVLLVLIVGMLLYTSNMNAAAWREPGQRDTYIYNVHVEGLSGREVEGTTTIMVPIPATIEENLLQMPLRKNHLLYKTL